VSITVICLTRPASVTGNFTRMTNVLFVMSQDSSLYHVALADRQPRLLPRRRCWHIGLERVIRDYFFSDPRCIWCALRNKTSPIDRHGYRSSADYQRLAAALPPGLLDDKDTGLWELGTDFYAPYTNRNYSTCVIGIRYASILVCMDIIVWVCKHAYAFLCSLALLLANDAMILLLTLSDAHLSDAYSCDHMHHHMSSGSGVGP